jgi:thioredoxin reductase (NADPH)
LGFPIGISGQELADRALVQAQKFGANITIARATTGLSCSSRPYTVELSEGRVAYGRSIIVATGAAYRKLSFAGSGGGDRRRRELCRAGRSFSIW